MNAKTLSFICRVNKVSSAVFGVYIASSYHKPDNFSNAMRNLHFNQTQKFGILFYTSVIIRSITSRVVRVQEDLTIPKNCYRCATNVLIIVLTYAEIDARLASKSTFFRLSRSVSLNIVEHCFSISLQKTFFISYA